MKLYKSNVRLTIRKHFFSARVIDTWNDLPRHVVDAPSVNSFMNRLDKLWNDTGIGHLKLCFSAHHHTSTSIPHIKGPNTGSF